jgi:hypothetical protein
MVLKQMIKMPKGHAKLWVDLNNDRMVHIEYLASERIYLCNEVNNSLLLYLYGEENVEKLISKKKGRFVIKWDHRIISMTLN